MCEPTTPWFVARFSAHQVSECTFFFSGHIRCKLHDTAAPCIITSAKIRQGFGAAEWTRFLCRQLHLCTDNVPRHGNPVVRAPLDQSEIHEARDVGVDVLVIAS